MKTNKLAISLVSSFITSVKGTGVILFSMWMKLPLRYIQKVTLFFLLIKILNIVPMTQHANVEWADWG